MKSKIALPLDTVAVVIEKARAFDAQVDVDDPDSGPNPTDDKEIAILDNTPDNPVEEGLAATLSSLNDDELTQILALPWVARGDYDNAGWNEALRQAHEAKNKRIVHYLIGTPMLGSLVEEGLAEMGVAVSLPQEHGVR